jgi:hypothetical protein
MEDILKQGDAYRGRANMLGHRHYAIADQAGRRHIVLGVPTLILTAVVSTSIFASIDSSPSTGWKIAAGLVAGAAAILAALQTFFGFAELGEKHRKAGAAYLALRMRIDNFLLRAGTPGADRDAALEKLDEFVATFGSLDEQSPGFPARFFTRKRGRVEPDSVPHSN